jgi:hypothetical protein
VARPATAKRDLITASLPELVSLANYFPENLAGPAAAGRLGPMMDASERRIYAGYLAVQAVAGVALWVAFALSATVRSWFELMAERHAVMDAFVFADLFLVVAGSALGAWAVAGAKRWAVPVVAFTAGGIVYPTLYLVGWVSFTESGVACLAIMVPAAILTCWVAYQVWRASLRQAVGSS